MFHPQKLFKRIGPGVITGASDDDPSGIATYSQTGAKFGYSLLWLSLFTTPMMMAVQEMSARLGMVTGRGLADILRRHVSVRTVLLLSIGLFLVNAMNIGADLGAMAESARLVLALPSWLYLTGFAAVVVLLEVFVSYKRYVNVLRWLTLALFSYVIAAFLTSPDWANAIRHTLVPNLPSGDGVWTIIVAVLGTTISPYLFFWQASEEVEEETAEGRTTAKQRQGVTRRELKRMRTDVATGMIFSNLIMFFIIVATAGTLYSAGIGEIRSPAEAAEALRPLAGSATFVLFALGIIGTGLLAIPILATSASYALAEVFGWREGLSKKFRQARPFYLTIMVSIALGVGMNLLGLPAFNMLIVAAVLNGLLAPLMLWYIIRLADRSDVVGEHRSPPAVRLGGWLTFGLMTIAGAIVLLNFVKGSG